jgi:hypothetical protein
VFGSAEVHMMGSGMFEYTTEEIMYVFGPHFRHFTSLFCVWKVTLRQILTVLGLMNVDVKILMSVLGGLLQTHAVQRGIWVQTLHLFWY